MIDNSLQPEEQKFQKVLIDLIEESKHDLEEVTARIDVLNTMLQDKDMQTDRSENASFQIAKDERDVKVTVQGLLRKRINALEEESGQYTPTGIIKQGSIVELNLLAIAGNPPTGPDNFIVKLVSHELGKSTLGLIAIDSKVGAAILNHRAGENISISAPKGQIDYEIKRVY